jgi:hypothetical protein
MPGKSLLKLLVETDTKAVMIPSWEHGLPPDAKAVELLENVRVPIAKTNPPEDADPLRAVPLRGVQELIESIIDGPGARLLANLDLAESAAERELPAENTADGNGIARILRQGGVRLSVPGAADQLVPR